MNQQMAGKDLLWEFVHKLFNYESNVASGYDM